MSSRHLRVHFPPNECPHAECDKRFGQKRDLDRHVIAKHAAEASQSDGLFCPHSGCKYAEGGSKVCKRRDNLARHIRTKHERGT
jgi:hypothetical protein